MDTPLTLKAGVSENVRSTRVRLNGLRHPSGDQTSGWYMWAGEELSHAADFFVPEHLAHVVEWRPEITRFLALPTGWRFLVAGEYEDAWYDPSLLQI